MKWILLHRSITSVCHKITQDYMYVAVKKNLSHELDTFTPRVYFSVAQDYTRWQNYILLEQIIDFFINDW